MLKRFLYAQRKHARVLPGVLNIVTLLNCQCCEKYSPIYYMFGYPKDIV